MAFFIPAEASEMITTLMALFL